MNANEHNAVKKPVSRFSIWGLAFGCGIGMSREFAARVFDAFERERTSAVNNIEGTGLGMALTKNLVTHF